MSGQQDRQEQASQPVPTGSNMASTQPPAGGHDQLNANGHLADAIAPQAGLSHDASGDRAGPHVSARSFVEPSPRVSSPKPGSWADLRQRLERLPYGHPSSPYHVDGEPKPPPPRLKHLELAPPGREPSKAGPEPPQAAAEPPQVAAEPPQVAAEPPQVAAEPPQAAAEPPQAAAEPSRVASMRATSLPAGRGPGFSASSSRPRLASDGSWSWGPARLTPEQVRIAQDGYERFRSAEGRDLFGNYGVSGLTAKLRQVEEQLEHGRLAPQTEHHALLEIDVFRARFADLLRLHPDRSPELLASRVPGALSYAFVFGTDHYAGGILLVQDALEARGFELQARKNSWSSVANRCVFTMWHDPLSELPFEVQFHTGASLDAQQLARTSASLINDPRIPAEEAASLRSDLASAWAALPSPPGNARIGDYRRYGSSATR